MAAVYSVFTSPNHAPIPNHLPTLIVTPHGQPSNILYSYLHTNFNAENYLLTPSPQGDLCVAKLFPPARESARGAKYPASDPGHGGGASSRAVRCEASRNLKWTITNAGVMSPIYKLSLPSPDGPDLPLFQVSKPNQNANFWSMFYFAYAGHMIPPKRIEFGKIQKNPPGPGGGGTRISITGKTPEEKAVWQTLGEGNEDCVEWVVLCAALNLLDDEILKAAEKAGAAPAASAPPAAVPQQQVPPPSAGPGAPGGRQPLNATPPSRQGSFNVPPSNGVPPGRQQAPVNGQMPQRPPPQQYPSQQSLNSNGGSGPLPRGGPPPPQQVGRGPPPGQYPPPQRGGSLQSQGGPPPPGQYPPPQRGPGAPPPPQGYPQQRGPPPPQGQGYPPQGGPPPQGYPQRGPPPQGYPPQGAGGPPPQGYPQQRPPQGAYPQGYPPARSGSVPQGGNGGRRV